MSKSLFERTPGLSWDTMLKTIKVKLKAIINPNMYIFFEKGTRGGISYISNNFSKANNKYLKPYDLKEAKISKCQNFFQQVDSNGKIGKSLT